MIYDSLLEKIMQHFASGKYTEEVISAKEFFRKFIGNFDEEGNDFEMKMTQFLEWYLFTRDLKEEGKPPLEALEESGVIEFSQEEREGLSSLLNNRHSLFEFIKLKKEDLYAKDLFASEKLVIKSADVLIGLRQGEIFDARLIPVGETYIFSGAFCFHPSETNKFILKEIKSCRKLIKKMTDATEINLEREKLMQKLVTMYYTFKHYRQLGLKDVYSNKLDLKL